MFPSTVRFKDWQNCQCGSKKGISLRKYFKLIVRNFNLILYLIFVPCLWMNVVIVFILNKPHSLTKSLYYIDQERTKQL